MKLDWKEYADCIRQVAAEGIVLLKNDNEALPIKKGEKAAVFGRIQLDYYYAGAGSGGMVNVPYVTNIPDSLKESGFCDLDEELLSVYREWEKEHPFNAGDGSWASEPFCQEEMPLTEEIVKSARERSDLAVVIIGRLAGEDKDSELIPGSYYLQEEEEKMLSLVCKSFDRVAVLLNVGEIMDMSWVKKYDPSAVMIIWQGGIEGGRAAVDVLTGAVNPGGHLADTIAERIEDYPAYPNYGDEKKNIYAEDIYVGYRYFETAAKDKVLYPFGWGLSYTTFEVDAKDCSLVYDDNGNPRSIKVNLRAKNTGKVPGRPVAQIYIKAPAGKLAKPAKVLAEFEKFDELAPGESAEMAVSVMVENFASYDDGGYTGHRGCFVLEPGEYKVIVGQNAREESGSYPVSIDELYVVEQTGSALMPTELFKRMRYNEEAGEMEYEDAPVRDYSIKDRIDSAPPRKALPYSGDKGLKLSDVKTGSAGMDEFIAQLSDEDLICMTRMEGVYSPRSVDGTVGAFGGISDSLASCGIPVACVTDGPSGIRRDDGSMAYALPSGTLMACCFDPVIVEKLYEFEGIELLLNGVDSLLGPGINIHRHPVNGRNFEYFSEDPFLTGVMACAQLEGMAAAGTTGTIKHFAANNQERARTRIDSVVSERALREIYLKPFEMAIKDGNAYSVMTTYGAVNGIYTAGNYDLVTRILRDQWGYSGVVMTDWWAMVNDELYDGSAAYEKVPHFGSSPSMKNAGPMLRAQNDLYSVHKVSAANSGGDNIREWLDAGLITRDHLARSAENILGFILRSTKLDPKPEIEEFNRPEYDGKDKNRRIDEALQSPPPGCV